jgi:iron complex transport system substrate-binding protein
MKALAALATFALALVAAPAGAAPQRIVSLNLCADQLVLALADRGQIAALSRNAIDPELSAAAVQARGLRRIGASAEELLEIRPDLIVGQSPALAVLKGQPYRTLDPPFANTLEQVIATIRQVAAAVGHAERGEAMIARMRRDMAAIPRAGRGKVAAYYQRRGYLTGTGTLIDDMMTRLGLVNLAGRLGRPVLAQVSLEEMVAARPDYLIVESATERVSDLGTEMLHHPALRGMRRIAVPQAWTVCGGPAYVEAARSIARQIDAR